MLGSSTFPAAPVRLYAGYARELDVLPPPLIPVAGLRLRVSFCLVRDAMYAF